MELPLSRPLVSRLEWVDQVDSTNVALAAAANGQDAAAWPDFSVLVTDHQTRGRGRLGRDWVAPAGASLAISVLLRPSRLSMDAVGWLPLAVGLAMVRAVRALGERHDTPVLAGASLKWPNDVLVPPLVSAGSTSNLPRVQPAETRKVCGVLCELLAGGAVVVGAGLNLALAKHELPVPTATSLALAGAPGISADEALAAYLTELRALYAVLATGEVERVRDDVAAVCSTLGRSVRVLLPGGEMLTGVATALDDDGRIIVDSADGIRSVGAGDVTHLRY